MTSVGTSPESRSAEQDRRSTDPAAHLTSTRGRGYAAILLGATIALSGFPPLVNIPARLDVTRLVWFVALTPAAVLVYATWLISRRDAIGPRRPIPVVLSAGIVLLLAGGALSLLESARPTYSLCVGLMGILLPAGMFFWLRRAALPPALLAGGFFAALAAMLLRADAVFFGQYGLPTSLTLFNAKFSQRAYDFHYYTLGNPDHTAALLILPLAVAIYWASRNATTPMTRGWLIAFVGLGMITEVLLYERSILLAAAVVVVAPLVRRRRRRRTQLIGVGIVAALLAALVITAPHGYFVDVFSVSNSGSAGPSSGAVRLASVSSGFDAFLNHPVTGVGLGLFGGTTVPAGGTTVPAHFTIVQAAADMGVLGALGLTLLVGISLLGAWRALRVDDAPFPGAAAYGCGAYLLVATLSGSPPEGLFVGVVSIYALALAMFGALALPGREPGVIALADLGAPFAAWRNLPRRMTSRFARFPTVAWLTYGILWIPVGLWRFRGVPSVTLLSSSRETDYSRLLAAHAHGFGPLVEMLGPGQFLPAGITDDQGGYLFAPWLQSIFGGHTIDATIRSTFLAAICVLVVAYPLLFRRLFHSRIAAVAAPALLLLSAPFLTDDGFYWVPAVVLLLAVPGVLILVRRRKVDWRPALALAALATVSSLFRAQTGLGIMLALGCAALTATQRRRALATVLLAFVAYYALTTGILDVAYQARASRMGSYPVNTGGVANVTTWDSSAGHPFWHTAYIGLGVEKNRYGITYSDSVAAAYVRSVHPRAIYLSSAYEQALRARFLHLLTSDPGFVFGAYAIKARILAADALGPFPALLVLLPIAVAGGALRQRRLLLVAVAVLLLLVAAAPALVAVPSPDYEQPLLGLLAGITACSAGFLVARLAALGTRMTSSSVHLRELAPRSVDAQMWWSSPRHAVHDALWPRMRSRRGAVSAAVTTVAVLGGVGIRHELAASKPTVLSGAGATSSGPKLPSAGTTYSPMLADWPMRVLPAGWSVDTTRFHGVEARIQTTRGGLSVVTSPGSDAYQLVGPVRLLASGRYIAVVRGQVEHGGLELGVLNAQRNAWIATMPFAGRQPTPVSMPLKFAITRATQVRIMLTNYQTTPRSSAWVLRQVLLAGPGAIARPAVGRTPTHGTPSRRSHLRPGTPPSTRRRSSHSSSGRRP